MYSVHSSTLENWYYTLRSTHNLHFYLKQLCQNLANNHKSMLRKKCNYRLAVENSLVHCKFRISSSKTKSRLLIWWQLLLNQLHAFFEGLIFDQVAYIKHVLVCRRCCGYQSHFLDPCNMLSPPPSPRTQNYETGGEEYRLFIEFQAHWWGKKERGVWDDLRTQLDALNGIAWLWRRRVVEHFSRDWLTAEKIDEILHSSSRLSVHASRIDPNQARR